MSVYIKGMEMPMKCIECKLMKRCGKNDLDFICMPARIYVEDLTNACKPRPDWCPLVTVPEHGRLLKVLKTERECVIRDCDRNCGKCDLSLERSEILSAYDALISMLDTPPDPGR